MRDRLGVATVQVMEASAPHRIRPAPSPADESRDERALRRRLGVPEDAAKVLVFGETSHWDPNWLFTSEQYYRWRIRHVLDGVIAELHRQPRRVFSLESLFFVRMYWDRRPDQREHIRSLVNEGRLRLTGSGITTPDTLLPSTEAIIRDYLYGQQWLRENGMTVEPRLAYMPDCFGHSPALPAVLRALGYDRAAITRIDGMYFVGSDFRPRSAFPLPGSSAQTLEQLATQAFVWRAPDGSEILCHWNAFSYFQGDMLAHLGIIRWMGLVFGIPWRTGRQVARRIRSLVAELGPLARTPYLFCPMGCDFNGPLDDLVGLLDRYNQTHYETTGIWAVNAGLDDYLDLVGEHQHELPTVELDPNPYWMGFYASRPELKRRCNALSAKLVLAEKASVLRSTRAAAAAQADPGCGCSAVEMPAPTVQLRGELDQAWDIVVVSNHHDFITGTSPDRVWQGEQRDWIERAERIADGAFDQLVAPAPQVTSGGRSRPPSWRRTGGELAVSTDHYRLVLSEEAGGAIVSLRHTPDGPELLNGPSNELVAYRDSGGLWRLGHEYRGGSFAAVEHASTRSAAIEAREVADTLEVTVQSELGGRPMVRRLWLQQDSPMIRMRLSGAAASRRTITCRFATNTLARSLTMDVPGGVVERPHHKLYDPTFWPARTFVHAVDPSGWGLAAFLSGPACASLGDDGALEWIALRNAPRERAWGVVPVPAHPASGTSDEELDFDYAVWFTRQGDFRANRLFELARRDLWPRWLGPQAESLAAEVDAGVQVDGENVWVSAIKPADRGPGIIVRLQSAGAEPTEVKLRWTGRAVRSARLCDARERDLAPLSTDGGAAVVPIRSAIVSVRLLF